MSSIGGINENLPQNGTGTVPYIPNRPDLPGPPHYPPSFNVTPVPFPRAGNPDWVPADTRYIHTADVPGATPKTDPPDH
jgi:hypothetical protein